MISIWLCMINYQGFIHDGRIYSMLALSKLHPENFEHDLFLAYGSQESFTTFPFLYAWLIKKMGLDTAAFILSSAGQVAWLAGLLTLILRMTKGWAAVAALAGVVFFSRYYDIIGIFSYGEPFPSPRIFAEALSFFALSALYQRRYVVTLLYLLPGVVLHPLMSLFGCSLWLATLLLDNALPIKIRAALLGCIAAAAALLVALKIPPFSLFLVPYDPQWLDILQRAERSSTLIWLWTVPDCFRIAYLMLALGIAWKLKAHAYSEHIPAIIGCALLWIITWAFFCGVRHDIFITQLQPWRAMWLVQIFSLTAQSILILKLWKNDTADRWFATSLLLAMLQVCYINQSGITAFLTVIAGLAIRQFFKKSTLEIIKRPMVSLYIPILLIAGQAGLSLLRAASKADFSIKIIDNFAAATPLTLAITALACGFLAALSTAYLAPKFSHLRNIGCPAIAISGMLVGVGLYIWSEPYLNSSHKLSPEQTELITQLQSSIPKDAVVYSNDGLMWSWFVVQRSYYADGLQVAGYLFSRGSAIEGFRRLSLLCDADLPGCPAWNFVDRSRENPQAFWKARIPVLCQDKALDFIAIKGTILPFGQTFFATNPKLQTTLISCRNFK